MPFTLLMTTNSKEEAMVIESKLAAAGIGCKVEQESIGKLYGLSQNGLGEMKIFVDEDQIEKASQALED